MHCTNSFEVNIPPYSPASPISHTKAAVVTEAMRVIEGGAHRDFCVTDLDQLRYQVSYVQLRGNL